MVPLNCTQQPLKENVIMRTPSLSSHLLIVATILFFGIRAELSAAETPTPAAAAKPNTLSSAEQADGWLLLFDGQTLFGWKPSSNANWQAVDGTLTASEGEAGLLTTTSSFGDYELNVDFRSGQGVNSGVFLHTIPNPTVADLKTKCYEVNISTEAKTDWPTGSIVQRQKPPAKPLEKIPSEDEVIQKRTDFMDDQYSSKLGTPSLRWHTFNITVKSSRILVKLDGKTTADYTDPTPLGRGPIGLQFRKGKIAFRNVKLRPLGTKSIFNGRDLTGWKPYPGMAAVCSVTPEGCIRLQNGKGQLETVGQYGDFILQLDVFVAGKGLNSGVFFRCIPGEFQNGYESQIQNGYKDGDRNKPADCGTGGIFRRQNARKVVADDFTWFTKTILADGPHMAVWVNGYQVSDWTDVRRPDKNPRKGLRTEPGTIVLQGHDPTTDIKFRNFRIEELPAR